jgi:hypothetical protein
LTLLKLAPLGRAKFGGTQTQPEKGAPSPKKDATGATWPTFTALDAWSDMNQAAHRKHDES